MRIMITNDHHILLLNNNIKSFDRIKYYVNSFDIDTVKNSLITSNKLIVSDEFFIKG